MNKLFIALLTVIAISAAPAFGIRTRGQAAQQIAATRSVDDVVVGRGGAPASQIVVSDDEDDSYDEADRARDARQDNEAEYWATVDFAQRDEATQNARERAAQIDALKARTQAAVAQAAQIARNGATAAAAFVRQNPRAAGAAAFAAAMLYLGTDAQCIGFGPLALYC